MKIINGLNEIINTFDTFILDQWGVLHNGGDAFPEAILALEFLKSKNKKVIILSNSGKPGAYSHSRLQESGIRRDLYLDVLTSGDHMRHNFQSGKYKNLGKNAFHFPWNDDMGVLEDCDLNAVPIEQASFVLCCGVDRGEVDCYLDDLKIAYKNKLQLVVSNPDLVAMSPDGNLHLCPGSIAKVYQEMGGIVHWHGKPQKEIYQMCNELVNGWENAVAVGDSLEHDIAGANIANVSSIFITSGIHSTEIIDQESITALCNKFSVEMTYSLDWFKQ